MRKWQHTKYTLQQATVGGCLKSAESQPTRPFEHMCRERGIGDTGGQNMAHTCQMSSCVR